MITLCERAVANALWVAIATGQLWKAFHNAENFEPDPFVDAPADTGQVASRFNDLTRPSDCARRCPQLVGAWKLMSYFEKPVEGAVAQQTDDAYLAYSGCHFIAGGAKSIRGRLSACVDSSGCA